MDEQLFTVRGMTCGGCLASVERAVKSAAPGASVHIDMDNGVVRVSPPGDLAAIKDAVQSAGFDVE
ncbi:heavy-metal-associated domain-containing protein [Phaeovibrio sulfidiphilus]|uniref:Heavy-metal-associated domain-containing protein n=1 Tax=Phaeovibrio sulfidiphilus TaxID=1220600 RepID=A0A8J7CPL5_9PROT|nr:heavy-metal-associated domain-containing protein [Phaeovibrio sulfidiphilus]MBE1237142.1 heavy-metal-associated domain-containing protein [Phaeovibrio sulfidiphilus]